MFNCKCCNYETDIKPNYTRHLKTKRHLTKIVLSNNSVPIITNDVPIITNHFTCEYCNSNYTKVSSLNRHQKSCIKQILEHHKKEFEINKKELENKDKQLKLTIKSNDKMMSKLKKSFSSEITELKQEKDLEIKELKDENKKLNNEIHRINNKQISVLQNNLKPVNNNNSQIIIHNYPNAPNLSFPENIRSDDTLEQYIQLGGVRGMGKFISDHWAKDINPVDRSIWMVDPSRNKFLIRCKDAWVIDIDGKQFQELNIKRIYKIFDDYLQTLDPTADDFDIYQHTKTMEFITDIKTKNMIVKGLKEAGKYLVYDKEKFPDIEAIPETIPEIESNILSN